MSDFGFRISSAALSTLIEPPFRGCFPAPEIVGYISQEAVPRQPNILAFVVGHPTTNGVFWGKMDRNSSCVSEPFFLQFPHLNSRADLPCLNDFYARAECG